MEATAAYCYANWPLVLEFLKVALSGPPMAVIALLAILVIFRSQVRQWMRTHTPKEVEVSAAGARLKVTMQGQAEPTVPLPEVHGHGQAGAPINAQVPAEWADDPHAAGVLAFLQTSPGPATGNVLDIVRQLRFERLLQVMFGTQQAALEFLHDQPGPQPADQFEAFYKEHQQRVGDSARSFTDWAGFLASREILVITPVNGASHYDVTDLGRKYVEYVRAFYPYKAGLNLLG